MSDSVLEKDKKKDVKRDKMMNKLMSLCHGMVRLTSPRIRAVAFSWLVISLSTVAACALPVFRYGLEQWEAGLPHILKEPTDYANVSNDDWRNLARSMSGHLEVTVIDDQLREEIDLTPGVYVNGGSYFQYMLRMGDLPEDINDIQRMIIGPHAKRLGNRLLAGDSAVFIVVGGSDEARQQAVKTVQDRLAVIDEYLTINDDVVESWVIRQQNDPMVYNPRKRRQINSLIPLSISFSYMDIPEQTPLGLQLRAVAGDDNWSHTIDRTSTEKPNPPSSLSETYLFAVFGRGRTDFTRSSQQT